jgi:parallel beta-helix repeat protein
VTVANGANAVITNLTLQGPINTTSCSDLIYGIYVKNATANVIGNRILNIATTNPALYGCQSGVAIRFGGQALHYAASGNISSNSISGYQKGGIVVDGVGTNVSVTGNAVTGSVAAYGVTATNGIQISRGAISTVTDNVVSNNSYGNDPCGSLADGIILYNLVTPGVTITNNQVTGNDEGIALYNDSSTASKVTITGNTVYRNYALGIHIDANSTENNVWLNAIYLNAIFDEADETGSFTSPNDWGTTDSSKGNILGPNGNNVFTQHLGAVCH